MSSSLLNSLRRTAIVLLLLCVLLALLCAPAAASTDLVPRDDSAGTGIGRALATREQLERLSARELKQFIASRGAVCNGCVDKSNLIEVAFHVRGVLTRSEQALTEMTLVSAASPVDHAASLSLLRTLTEEEAAHVNTVMAQRAILIDANYRCKRTGLENQTSILCETIVPSAL